jgi:hypothetical protein
MHFNCALLLFWERAVQKEDGAREKMWASSWILALPLLLTFADLYCTLHK